MLDRFYSECQAIVWVIAKLRAERFSSSKYDTKLRIESKNHFEIEF